MREMIFDAPWWLPAMIAAIGVTLFVYGNKRVDATLRNVGLVVVGLAIALIVVSYLVDTDVEKVTQRTRQLVAAVGQKDWKTLESLLDKQTSFAIYHNRDELIAGASATADKIGFRGARITSLKIQQNGSLITADLDVISQQDMPPYPMPSSWRLSWQGTNEGWFLKEIAPLPSQTLKPDQVIGHLTAPKRP